VTAPGRVTAPERRAELFLGLAAAAVVGRLWVMPLGSSLWLDEFGTTWLASGPVRGIVERARLFPQSIPYGALVEAVTGATGWSEASLRWPSVVAMLASAWLVFRLGEELLDRATGVASAAVFLLLPQVEFSAADARPYAFGVLAATAALRCLVAWLDRGRAKDGAGYVLFAALTVYFQYLFATALVAHAAYAWRRRRSEAVSMAARACGAGALVALLLPAALLVAEIGRGAGAHAFGGAAGPMDLFRALVPTRAIGLLVPAALVAMAFGKVRGLRSGLQVPRDRDTLVLLATGAVAPPLILYVLSRWFGASLLEGRYLLAASPAWSVLLGALLARLRPDGASNVVAALALALALVLRGELTRGPIAHARENWRSAVAALDAANGDHAVFLAGSFVESQDPSIVRDPRHEAYLLAPLSYYRTRGPAEVLPLRAGGAANAEGERRLAPALAAGRFALIERNSRFPSWASWLEARLRPLGYSVREVWRDDALRAVVFVRSSP